jgi:hypothetical protein
MAAHIIDAMDTFQELATTSRVLFNEDGLSVIDLGASACTEPDRGPAELVRMDTFIRHISEDELGNNSWQLASRRDVAFQADGYGPGEVGPALPADPSADDWLLDRVLGKPPRPPPHRWLTDRTHVRVHGDGERRLRMRIWVDTARLLTTPRLSIWLDGTTLAHATPDANGNVEFDLRTRCTGWCDLYIVISTMHEFWRGAGDLRGMKLLGLEWTAATP